MLVVKPKPSRLKEFAPEVKQSSGVKKKTEATVFVRSYSRHSLQRGDIVVFLPNVREDIYPVGRRYLLIEYNLDQEYHTGYDAVYHVIRDGVYL